MKLSILKGVAKLFMFITATMLFFVFINVLPVKAYSPQARISFTFDDGAKSIYERAMPVLAKHNFPGVLYGETGPLNSGEDWVMTWDQIRDLRDTYGWEIGSHTINHPYLTQISNTKLINELQGSLNDFAAEGINVTTFATPYGDYNNKVLSYIARYYQSHRAAWGGANQWPDIYNDYQLISLEAAHNIPPSVIKTWIDEAAANDQWLVILLHDIVEGVAQEYQYNVNDLQEIVDYVATLPIKVTTITNGLKYSNQTNLASNYSFTELDSGLWAKNWTRTNTTHVTIDRNNHGNTPEPKKSLKITAGASQYEARSALIAVDSGQEYLMRAYYNAQNLTNGGWAVWVNEFDSADNWLSGQWLGGNYANFVGNRYYEYKPTSAGVAKIMIHIFTEVNSALTLYVDSVELKALTAAGPDITPPVITLVEPAIVNLEIGDSFTDPGATAFDETDGDISANIVVGGDVVNTSAVGTYIITYNVQDSSGNSAQEVTRSVIVSPPLSSNADLSDLKVDGGTVAFFSPTILEYMIELPEGTIVVPTVAATAADANASINITPASSLPGVTTILVTAEDGVTTKLYSIIFSFPGIVPDNTPPRITLIGAATVNLNVGDLFTDPGATAIDDRDGDISANIVIGGDTVDTNNADTYIITYNVQDAAGNSATEKTRTVNVSEVPLSSNADLSDLAVDSVTVSGFNPVTLNYQLELPAETTVVPTVTAIAANPAATVVITPAVTLPGTTEVLVTAEDGVTTKLYTIAFTVVGVNPNLVANFSFENLSGDWALAWTANDPNVVIDTNGNGYGAYPQNSLKITAGINQRIAMSDLIPVNYSSSYVLSYFHKMENFTGVSGVAVYIDEFNSAGGWVGGKWLGGTYAAETGIKAYTYIPSLVTVSQIQIHLFTEANSTLTYYIDDVKLIEQ